VAAGLTKRSEIAQARELLDASSVNTLGVILNKRTQPIPGFIYRYL
jgi:Mrp family chromosome partitioning ATPase